MSDLLTRALPIAADDPAVNANALQHWYYFAMPVAEGYSSAGPNREAGIPLHRQALENAERILLTAPATDTDELRALLFWAKQTRMLLRLTAPEVPAEELALAGAESDTVHREIYEADYDERLRGRIESTFRTMCSARRRALELVAMGPPYDEETVSLLATYVEGWDRCLGWPVAPLVNDAAFRAHAAATIGERTAAKAHPAPTATISVKDLVEQDGPSPFELEGRLLLLLWLGVDQESFSRLAAEAIGERAPAIVLDKLLALGFDVNAIARDRTLLHVAVEAANTAAIGKLLAAGADPKKKVQKVSALDLAQKKKRAAVIQALAGGGAATASEAALAASLRAAAAALEPQSLAWIGSTFGITEPNPSKIIEDVLANQPASPQEVLADANALFIFDRYVIARIVRDAGYVVDVTIKGGVLTKCVTASGTITVEGDVADESGATLVAANDVAIAGGLMTQGDTIVGGWLRARDYVWGDYNDGSLVVGEGVATPLLVMTDHTFECEGELEIERTVIDDRGEHRTVFVPAILDEHALPSYQKARALLKRGAPVILGVAPTKKKPAPVKAKAVKKSPAPKAKPTAKPAPKAVKKSPASKAAPKAKAPARVKPKPKKR